MVEIQIALVFMISENHIVLIKYKKSIIMLQTIMLSNNKPLLLKNIIMLMFRKTKIQRKFILYSI